MRMLMQSLRISERLVSSSQCVPIEAASAALPKWSICSTQWRGVKTVPESPVTTGRQRLVILGSGWAAGRLLRDIDSSLYDYTVGLALLIIFQSLTRPFVHMEKGSLMLMLSFNLIWTYLCLACRSYHHGITWSLRPCWPALVLAHWNAELLPSLSQTSNPA